MSERNKKHPRLRGKIYHIWFTHKDPLVGGEIPETEIDTMIATEFDEREARNKGMKAIDRQVAKEILLILLENQGNPGTVWLNTQRSIMEFIDAELEAWEERKSGSRGGPSCVIF